MPYGRRKYTSRKRTSYTKSRNSYRRKAPATTKRFRRRRTRYTKVSSLRPKWINPISQSQLVCFNYTDSSFSVTLAAVNGYSNYYVFRGNGPYDPDYTGVGVQPYGYDQYCGTNLFNYYRCPASSIRVYFRPEATYANMRRLHAFIIPLRIANPVMTDVSDVRTLPMHKETTYDGSTETTKGAKLKHYCTTKKIFTEGTTKDFGFTSGVSTLPAGQWYWLVHFYADEFDDETVYIYFDVKIKYYTKLTRADLPNES